MSRFAKGMLAGAGALALFAIVVFFGLAALGAFDVAADQPAGAIAETILPFVRERAIDARADDIDVPRLDDKAMIAEGAGHYAAMCTGCHLAPGMHDNEMRPGMNPMPPELARMPAEEPAEQFWIVKHGIEMTGMPAWGKTHSDAEIWNIVAFLQKLPTLSPEQYKAMTAGARRARRTRYTKAATEVSVRVVFAAALAALVFVPPARAQDDDMGRHARAWSMRKNNPIDLRPENHDDRAMPPMSGMTTTWRPCR